MSEGQRAEMLVMLSAVAMHGLLSAERRTTDTPDTVAAFAANTAIKVMDRIQQKLKPS